MQDRCGRRGEGEVLVDQQDYEEYRQTSEEQDVKKTRQIGSQTVTGHLEETSTQRELFFMQADIEDQ